jgi:alpha,alpha-trehalase
MNLRRFFIRYSPGPSVPSRNAHDLPDARAYVDHIGASELAVFINFDCCLLPLDDEQAQRSHLPENLRQTVRALSEVCSVVVISARDAQSVRLWLDVEGVTIAGNHGLEIADAAGRRIDPRKADGYLPVLATAAAELSERLAQVDSVRLEKKRFCISIHFEQASPEQVQVVEGRVDEVLADHPDLERFQGRGTFFIIPAVDWSEGRAVDWLLDALDLDQPGVTPLYLGGTPTDESAFEALAERGIGIVIGEVRTTKADFRLADGGMIPQFLGDLSRRMRLLLRREAWEVVYDRFEADKEKLRETLCALGNGYVVTRAAAPEAVADDVHYPGTYLAGAYNRLETERLGERVENEDLVNFPNWLPLQFRVNDGEWFDLEEVDIVSFEQRLDMKRGVLHRTVCFRDSQARTTRLEEARLVHMGDPHLAALQTHITAVDWSGELTLRSLLDARVTNDGVAGYRGLHNSHLEVIDLEEVDDETVALRVRTSDSRIEVAQASRTRLFTDDALLEPPRQLVHDPEGLIGHHVTTTMKVGGRLSVEKVVAMHSSRDFAIYEAKYAAQKLARRAGSFHELLESHHRAWNHVWRRFDIGLSANRDMDALGDPAKILRWHVFHLVQTASPNTRDLDVGIPARGWHGEAYRGHVFWDELFVFPLLNLRAPEITRALLLYRYRRLDEARARARQIGHRGALFAWESASDGEEKTPEMSLDQRTQTWFREHTWLQRHVGAAVAYIVWQYYQVTADLEFLDSYGSELIVEIARFFASIARHNKELDRYEIWGVVGPDEYHSRYPGADKLGVRNNAYTNVLAAWVACRALDVLRLLPRQRAIELCERLHLRHPEIERIEEISRKMRVLFYGDGLIEQFEGYDSLEELDWEHYRRTLDGDLKKIVGTLESEGDDINRYKVSKQADVLMLFYLFSSAELEEIFGRLGYRFDDEVMRRNVDHYLERTAHGSSLSSIVHSWVLANVDLNEAWDLFTTALASDVADTRGGTTSEGIHLGAMAGTVDIVERVFVGIEVHEDVLWFDPALPDEVDHVHLNLRYRGHQLAVTLDHEQLRVTSADTRAEPIHIGFRGEVHPLSRFETMRLSLGGADVTGV